MKATTLLAKWLQANAKGVELVLEVEGPVSFPATTCGVVKFEVFDKEKRRDSDVILLTATLAALTPFAYQRAKGHFQKLHERIQSPRGAMKGMAFILSCTMMLEDTNNREGIACYRLEVMHSNVRSLTQMLIDMGAASEEEAPKIRDFQQLESFFPPTAEEAHNSRFTAKLSDLFSVGRGRGRY